MEKTFKEMIERVEKAQADLETGLQVPLKKLLHVDDDKFVKKVVQTGMRNFPNTEIIHYFSGKEALEKIEQDQPDMILLNLVRNGLDRGQFIEELKERGILEKFPVIFFTGKSRPDEIEKLKNMGAKGVICKPVRLKSIPDKIFGHWNEIQKEKATS